MSLAEYQEYINTHLGGTATPAKTPEPGELSNIAVTLMDRVKQQGGQYVILHPTIVYRKGMPLRLQAQLLKTATGTAQALAALAAGYADMSILSKTEASSSGSAPTLPDDKPTATYRTPRLSRRDVSRLQQMLKALGVYSGNINGIYDSANEKP